MWHHCRLLFSGHSYVSLLSWFVLASGCLLLAPHSPRCHLDGRWFFCGAWLHFIGSLNVVSPCFLAGCLAGLCSRLLASLLAFLLACLVACPACVLACLPVCLLACLLSFWLVCSLVCWVACLFACLLACLFACLLSCSIRLSVSWTVDRYFGTLHACVVRYGSDHLGATSHQTLSGPTHATSHGQLLGNSSHVFHTVLSLRACLPPLSTPVSSRFHNAC